MEKLLKQMVDRLDILIKLQALTAFKSSNQSERIMGLYALGITQSDIATILGSKINIVTSVVSKAAKAQRKRAGDKKA